MLPKACLNCNAPLVEQFNFCPICSQKTDLHRLSVHEIAHEALHFFIHADRSVLHLVRDLIRKTGVVAKEYVQGKRKKYFPPLNFFLITAGLFVLSLTLLWDTSQHEIAFNDPRIAGIADPGKREFVRQMLERQLTAIQFIAKNSNFINMIAAPAFALFYYLFYIKGKYNYAEHLIAVMYMNAFTSLIYALIFTPLSVLFGGGQSGPSLTLTLIYFAGTITYHSIFYYRFINKGTTGSAWKAFGVTFFVSLLWFCLTAFLVGAFIYNRMWGMV